MTTFHVATPNGQVASYTGDYKVTDAGVLTVTPNQGNPLVFSPNGWWAIEVTEAPAPPPSPVSA